MLLHILSAGVPETVGSRRAKIEGCSCEMMNLAVLRNFLDAAPWQFHTMSFMRTDWKGKTQRKKKKKKENTA